MQAKKESVLKKIGRYISMIVTNKTGSHNYVTAKRIVIYKEKNPSKISKKNVKSIYKHQPDIKAYNPNDDEKVSQSNIRVIPGGKSQQDGRTNSIKVVQRANEQRIQEQKASEQSQKEQRKQIIEQVIKENIERLITNEVNESFEYMNNIWIDSYGIRGNEKYDIEYRWALINDNGKTEVRTLLSGNFKEILLEAALSEGCANKQSLDFLIASAYESHARPVNLDEYDNRPQIYIVDPQQYGRVPRGYGYRDAA